MARYREIFEMLKGEIRTGKFGSGQSFPSERALMRRFSVARETVRRAIEELRKESLIEPRQGTMNALAPHARERAGGMFGVIMPDATYPFYSRICAGIERCAKRTKEGSFSLLSADLGFTDRSSQAERALCFAEVCVREKVCGVFFQPLQLAGNSDRANREILSLFARHDIPVVLLDSDIVPPPRRSACDLVGVDNIAIGHDLGQHVIRRGAKRIVYFSNPHAAPTALLRGYGVSLAATEAGLPWTDGNVIFADPTDEAAARRLFVGKKRPDAIVAVNDYVAALLLKTLKAIGRKVPDDVLLAGVNGDAASAEADPPITTAVQPCERIGEAAVQLMLQRIADPDLPPRVVHFAAPVTERASTARRRNEDFVRKGQKGKVKKMNSAHSLLLALTVGAFTVVSAAAAQNTQGGGGLLIGQPTGLLVTVGPGPARDLCMVYGDRDYGTADRLAWPSCIPVGKVGASSENSVCKVPLPKGWGTASAKRLRILTMVSGRKDLDYTELEYVQSTTASGAFCAQHIDTQIRPDGRTGVSMDFQIDSHTGQTGNEGSYSRLYGAMDDWNTRYLLTVGNAYDRVISWPYDSSASAGFITTRENMRMWYTNRYRTVQDMTGFSVTNLTTGESMKLDDFSGWGAKAPPANGTKQATHTLWLFGANAWQAGQDMGTVGKIYSCTIVTGVTQAVARDFVPAKQGNKVGLWDKVTKTIFCSNTGTALVAGPEIPPPPDIVYDWSASIRCDRLGLACTGGEQAVSVNMAGTLPVAPDAEHDRATRKHEGIPSFAIDQTSGRMWATWYGSPDGTTTYGENADNYVILATSDDGENWSEVAVADPDGLGGRRAFDPEIWIDDAGILHWSWTDAVEQKTDTMNLMEVTIPASTVPKAFPVAKCIGHGVMMCKPTRLADGRILYPVANWKSAPSANFYERNAEGVLEFVGGITIPQADRVFDEHIMIQRDGGSLYALVRGLGNPTALYESTSADGGQTWSAAVASALGHPSARLFMRRLASGNVLLVKHGDIGETTTRTKLKAFLSEDGGATWKGGLLLDDASEGEISYPDGDQGSDGVIHVIYDQDRLGKRNILLASFTEADVLAGTDVSGKVTLRRDVHHGNSFAGDEHRSLKAESVVPDFSVAIEPGEPRELYMVYGRRDYGTEDPKKWPHCVKLASIPSSAESTVYAFSLPEGWGAANTKFRLFAVSDRVLLEYVQSTGSGSSQQWIDTGICPDGKTGVSIDFQVDSHTGWKDADGNWSRLYGALDDWAFRYVLTIGNSTSRIIAWPYDSSASTGFSTAAGDVNIWSPNRYRTVQDMSGLSITNLTTGESMKYDDFANGYGAKAPPANGTKRLTSTLWLFGMNAKITVGRADTVGKIYSCTIVTGATQTVARDFVPAKQGDKVGLYDKVTKTLFCSASATPLVAGPEKQGGDVPVGWSELCEALSKPGLMLILK